MSSPQTSNDSESEDKTMEDLGNSDEYQVSFHAPRLLYGGIIGFNSSKKEQLESEFGVALTVPGIRDSGNSTISIKGGSKEDVCKARKKIESMLLALRMREPPTHFTCAPACTEDVKAKFNQVKADILAAGYPDIDESLFIETEKIHITFACCTLLDECERKEATQVFQECCQEHVEKKTPIEVKVRGLKKFARDKPNKAHVIFAGIESPILQELADKVLAGYKKAQLSSEDRGNTANLHLTMLNVRYRKQVNRKASGSFDATMILEKYADFDFGSFNVSELHLSQMGTKDETGFYKPLCVIKF